MLETDQKNPAAKLIEAILAAAPDKRAIVMTAAQQLRQQGMQTRNWEIAKNMLLQLHLGMDVVQKATGLASEARKQLQTGVDEGCSCESVASKKMG